MCASIVRIKHSYIHSDESQFPFGVTVAKFGFIVLCRILHNRRSFGFMVATCRDGVLAIKVPVISRWLAVQWTFSLRLETTTIIVICTRHYWRWGRLSNFSMVLGIAGRHQLSVLTASVGRRFELSLNWIINRQLIRVTTSGAFYFFIYYNGSVTWFSWFHVCIKSLWHWVIIPCAGVVFSRKENNKYQLWSHWVC